MVVCSVHLLDGTTFEPKGIDRNSAGSAVFDKVVKHLELLETDYFGLTYRDKSGKKYWLDNSKKISKQVKGGTWVFEFQVKFYPPDPLILTEGLTRYQLCLQIRVDIFNGKLPCSFVTYALLGSYTVQSELSDYDPKELGAGTDYLSAFDFAPSQTQELLDKIAEVHKHHKGQTPAEADGNFLENAKKLAMYGVDLHDVKDNDNKDIVLGVCASGIIVYKDRLRINRFVWPKILKLSYKRNNFYVKIRPGEFEPHERTIGFQLATHKLAKRLWKTCVEHHAFFRLKMSEAPDTGTLFPRFNTRFRYSGRTQVQAKKAAEAAAREEPHITRTAERRSLVKDDKGRRKSDDVSHMNRPDNFTNDAADRTDAQKLGAAAAANEGKVKKEDKDKKGGGGLLARFLSPKEKGSKKSKEKGEATPSPVESLPPPTPSPPTERDKLEQKSKVGMTWALPGMKELTEKRATNQALIDSGEEPLAVGGISVALDPREQALLDELFDCWDKDNTGYLDPDEVHALMRKYKDGLENKTIDKARKDISKKQKSPQDGLNRDEFAQFVKAAADGMIDADSLRDFVKFLNYNVKARQDMLDQLFAKWDSDKTGYLDEAEVESEMKKFRDGQENKAIDKAKKDLSRKQKNPQEHLVDKREFSQFVTMSADGMHGGVETFEDLVKFLYYNIGDKQAMLDDLFRKWDSDKSGYLNNDEVEAVMKQYKGGQENKAIDKATKDLKKKKKHPDDPRLDQQEFRELVAGAADGMHDPEEFKDFVAFLDKNAGARKMLLDDLFRKYDSDNSGYLNQDELEAVMKQYKGGQENKAIDKATKDLKRKKKHPDDPRVNRQEFRELVTGAADGMHNPEAFKEFVEFLDKNAGARKMLLDDLFRKYDSDNSGYLNQDELEAVMKQYKGGQENKAIDKATKDLKRKKKHPDDPRVNRQEFRELVTGAADGMHNPEAFKEFVEFLDKNAGARKMLLDDLFRKYDSDNSGYLNQDELEAVMKQYKGGQENKAIDKATKDLKRKKKHPDDPRVNRQEFRELVTGAADGMHNPEAFKEFVEFLDKNAGARKMLLDDLFRKWDSNGTGYLNQDEVEAVMKQYKGGHENKPIDKASKDLKKKKPHPDDPRINQQEFRELVAGAADGMHDHNAFGDFVNFLDNNAGDRQALLDALFKKWDSDGSGYLDQDELETVMKKYKGGQENKAIDKAKKDLHKKKKHPDDPRINKQEFSQLVTGASDGMHGPNAFKDFYAYLEKNAVERKQLLDALFKKWDSNASGYLNQGDVEAVMKQYKGGQENKAIDKASKDLKKKKKHPDDPLNQQEFRQLVAGAADGMNDHDAFRDFVNFLDNNAGEREKLLDALFKKWDNDGTGYLDQDEVESVMRKYKGGQENKAIDKATKDLKKKKKHPDDPRLNKQEFRQLVTGAADGMHHPNTFRDFVQFLDSNGGSRKVALDNLFWKWDDDNTGSVDQHEVEGVMKLYKDGEENKSIEQAKLDLNMTRPDPENKYISKCEFHTFVALSADGMKEPDQFDNFVEFLDVSVTDGTLYKVQMEFLPGMYGMAPGDSKSIDRQMQFLPVVPPAVETHKHVDEPMPFFEPAMNGDDSLERKRMPPPISKKPRGLSGFDSEEDRTDSPPTIKTESYKFNPGLDEIPMSTSNIPIVETKTHTVTYERDGIPYETEDSILISAHSVTTKSQTIDTTTYKTEKDGVIETRIERKITVTSDENEEFDHDALLRAAIEQVTNMNPDLSVERIECRQIEQVHGDTAV